MNDENEKRGNPENGQMTDVRLAETAGSDDNGNGNNGGNGSNSGIDTPPTPLRPLWMDLLIIVGVYIGSTIILSIIMGLITHILAGNLLTAMVISQVLIYAVTIPVAVMILRKRGMKKPTLPFSFRMSDPLTILWGVVLIFIMGVVIEPILDIFPADYLNDVNRLIIDGGGWGMLMTIVLAPVLEEILFRGLIQGSASREYSPIRAILIAAAIFGIVHLVPQQVINAFFCGLILGYIFYRTRSLVPVIAIHLINNVFAYITIRMSSQSGNQTIKQLIANDTWYWIIYGACTAIFVFAMYKLWNQLNKAENKAGKSFF